jgi:hypothetical protein
MPSPTNQYVVSLVVILSIRRCIGVIMNVSVQEHRALNKLVFDAVKFTILTSLSLLSLCRPSFPTVGLRISSEYFGSLCFLLLTYW